MDDYIMIKLSDFSKFPSGRDDNDGDFNGEKYRDSILAPQIKAAKASGKKIEISIEGVLNFGSSFLEEAFGGLVRKGIASKDDLKNLLRITPNNDKYARYRSVILKHIEEAKADT
ncbi:STAS-like domain-containing protein [uncultured Pseudophaeobacter sp.]|jgi:hypothetical protein|uniref:STAS-like domain-containing protein n=1 Tax=uncultured Pseudophaeobacter sp. TaxID=1759421 RepID=UPI0025CC2562|nr:STAS-like domain-containing protein [uncultured Pseudophaeobacter sp.]